MNIGVDGRLLFSNTGIGRYTRSLFFEFAPRTCNADQYYWFSDTDLRIPTEQTGDQRQQLPWSDNFHEIVARYSRRIIWTNWHLPPLLRHHKIDVYHGVCNFELPVRKMCRYVVTIHDLVPLFFPELVPKKHRLFFRLFMKRAAQTADMIITDSIHSQRDIVQYLGIPAEKIRVIYLGYDPQYRKIDDAQAMQQVLNRYGIQQPYLLFVGVIEPKKNLERLVEAFAMLQHNDMAQEKKLTLVIAGGKGWLSESLYKRIEALGVAQQVIFPGFVADADLPYLYNGAELFVFPSIYEGFGLPVLEAMACGVPVITSQVSSLPEIAGDAGRLIDPNSPAEICQAIADILGHPSLKTQMQHAGLAQARRFSWKRTAEETYNVYQELVV